MTTSRGGIAQSGQPTIALEVRGVGVDNAVRRILDDVSFQVPHGQTLVVAGETGFGGTTLARVIAGLRRPTRGRILVAAHDVTGPGPESRKRIGYVPAGGGLLPHLDAADNIRYGMRLRGISKYLAQQQFNKVVDVLGLRPSLGAKPHDMTTSQRTRVAIARLAVRMPRPLVWVVDATGEGNARGVAALIERFPGEDPTILICTDDQHDTGLVRDADRLIVIRAGKQAGDWPLSQVLADPPDLLTARLVLPTPLSECDGETTAGCVDCGRSRLPRPSWLETGTRVRVVLPPAALSLSETDTDIAGRVVDVRPEGARSRVLMAPVEIPGQRWLLYCDSNERPQHQERRRIAVDPDRMLVFDAATGKRLRHRSGASE